MHSDSVAASPTPGGSANQLRCGRFRTVLLGGLLGSLALWLAFRDLDLDSLGRSLAHVHGWWVLVALVSNGLSLLMVSLRWRLLFFRTTASGC